MHVRSNLCPYTGIRMQGQKSNNVVTHSSVLSIWQRYRYRYRYCIASRQINTVRATGTEPNMDLYV
jgi:hypothetical protein